MPVSTQLQHIYLREASWSLFSHEHGLPLTTLDKQYLTIAAGLLRPIAAGNPYVTRAHRDRQKQLFVNGRQALGIAQTEPNQTVGQLLNTTADTLGEIVEGTQVSEEDFQFANHVVRSMREIAVQNIEAIQTLV